MKHSNADILPVDLLFEIQKYIQGELLYIPKLKHNYKKWGDVTKGKALISERNNEIRTAFTGGYTIDELCVQYSLSPDSIKKIVYGKK